MYTQAYIAEASSLLAPRHHVSPPRDHVSPRPTSQTRRLTAQTRRLTVQTPRLTTSHRPDTTSHHVPPPRHDVSPPRHDVSPRLTTQTPRLSTSHRPRLGTASRPAGEPCDGSVTLNCQFVDTSWRGGGSRRRAVCCRIEAAKLAQVVWQLPPFNRLHLWCREIGDGENKLREFRNRILSTQ